MNRNKILWVLILLPIVAILIYYRTYPESLKDNFRINTNFDSYMSFVKKYGVDISKNITALKNLPVRYNDKTIFSKMNSTLFQPTKRENKIKLNPKQDIKNDIKSIRQILMCNNQTNCIKPYLQLKDTINVYFCKHWRHGVRFYFLIREGLLLHPKVRLVSNPDDSDVIFYLPESAPWHRTECNGSSYRKKLIILDETDGPNLFMPPDLDPKNPSGPSFLMIFKRSFVNRRDGEFRGYKNYINNKKVFPMTYTIVNAYVRAQFVPHSKRKTQVLSTLRGSRRDPTRLRVVQWVKEYTQARGISDAKSGEVNHASRTVISKGYFENMYDSKIIVTSNPSHWEGDFRLAEALASGALVFVDNMAVPRPYPFQHGVHVVYYNNRNKTDLFDKLDFYIADKKLVFKIAVQGYIHAMKYHRAENLIDYILRTYLVRKINLEKRNVNLDNFPSLDVDQFGYIDTGYSLKNNILKKLRSNS